METKIKEETKVSKTKREKILFWIYFINIFVAITALVGVLTVVPQTDPVWNSSTILSTLWPISEVLIATAFFSGSIAIIQSIVFFIKIVQKKKFTLTFISFYILMIFLTMFLSASSIAIISGTILLIPIFIQVPIILIKKDDVLTKEEANKNKYWNLQFYIK